MVSKLGRALEAPGETVTNTKLRLGRSGVGRGSRYASCRALTTVKLENPRLGVLPAHARLPRAALPEESRTPDSGDDGGGKGGGKTFRGHEAFLALLK